MIHRKRKIGTHQHGKLFNLVSMNLMAWREARNKSFAWKVRRRMKLDRNPLFVTLQDKLRVRPYALDRGVQSAQLYHVTNKPETLPFDQLPENYFIKANHGCTWNIACLDSKLYYFGNGDAFVRPDGRPAASDVIEKFRLTREQCVAKCNQWLQSRYRPGEWAYQNIEPEILVEESLSQAGGGALMDYKLHVMDGVVRAICVAGPVFRINRANRLFFDRNWKIFTSTQIKPMLDKHFYRRPDTLEEMVAAAERLGQGLDFIRVDMYNTTGGVRLGEITLYPFAGLPGTPSACPRFNRWLGDQWAMPV